MYADELKSARYRADRIREHFELNSISEYEKTVQRYVIWIIMHRRPAAEKQNPDFRRISRHPINVLPATVIEVLFKVLVLAETKIEEEMVRRRGALFFDG